LRGHTRTPSSNQEANQVESSDLQSSTHVLLSAEQSEASLRVTKGGYETNRHKSHLETVSLINPDFKAAVPWLQLQHAIIKARYL
jgi:hypothetical protein